MRDLNKQFIIKCPKCGYEYLASEIFYPEDLLGTTKNILRDDNGKILLISGGDNPCLEQEWECDHCGCNFKAKLEIKAESTYNRNYDFSEDYVITSNDDKEKLF